MPGKLTATIIGLAGLAVLGSTALAGELAAPSRNITIEGRKPVIFDHQIHLRTGQKCAVCHHDEKHRPRSEEEIAALKDRNALKCAGCHNREFAVSGLQKRKAVFHSRCRGCHKEEFNGRQGPTSCRGCHKKKKRRMVEGC